MTEQLANLAQTTLAASLPAVDGGTVEVVTVADAVGFPDEPVFRLNLGNGELARVTAVSGTEFTTERGAEGTSAPAHPAGQLVACVMTKGSLEALSISAAQLPASVVSSSGAASGRVPVANGSNGYSWEPQSEGGGDLLHGVGPPSTGLGVSGQSYIQQLEDGQMAALWTKYSAELPNAPFTAPNVELPAGYQGNGATFGEAFVAGEWANQEAGGVVNVAPGIIGNDALELFVRTHYRAKIGKTFCVIYNESTNLAEVPSLTHHTEPDDKWTFRAIGTKISLVRIPIATGKEEVVLEVISSAHASGKAGYGSWSEEESWKEAQAGEVEVKSNPTWGSPSSLFAGTSSVYVRPATGNAAEDTANINEAIQMALNFGLGHIVYGPGQYITNGGHTTYSQMWHQGQGKGTTEVKLAKEANRDVYQGYQFSTLTGTHHGGGIYEYAFSDMTINGSASEQSLTHASYCLRAYGIVPYLNNAGFMGGRYGGVWLEYSEATGGGFSSEQLYGSNLGHIHNCQIGGYVGPGQKAGELTGCKTTNGSAEATVPNIDGIIVGTPCAAGGIFPEGTRVKELKGPTNVLLSANAEKTEASCTLAFALPVVGLNMALQSDCWITGNNVFSFAALNGQGTTGCAIVAFGILVATTGVSVKAEGNHVYGRHTFGAYNQSGTCFWSNNVFETGDQAAFVMGAGGTLMGGNVLMNHGNGENLQVNTTSGSAVVTVPRTSLMNKLGGQLSGVGIYPGLFPTGTYVTEILSATEVKLNHNAEATVTGIGGPSNGSTLSSSLSTAGNITTLPVNALPNAIASGITIVTRDGASEYQFWNVTAEAAKGATSISVESQKPNFAYPAGSTAVESVFGGFLRSPKENGIQYGDSVTPVDAFAAAGWENKSCLGTFALGPICSNVANGMEEGRAVNFSKDEGANIMMIITTNPATMYRGTPNTGDQIAIVPHGEPTKGFFQSIAPAPGASITIVTENGGKANIPPGATAVSVLLIGGGGGGASGAVRASGTAALGGGGGGAGGVSHTLLPAASVGIGEVAVTIGAGGAGGAASSTESHEGEAGKGGGGTQLGMFCNASGGSGGASATGGTGGAGETHNGAAGGTPKSTEIGGAGESGPAGGGGSGGSISTAPTAEPSGKGGSGQAGAIGGGSSVTGEAGKPGTSTAAVVNTGGGGGGGGGSSTTGNGFEGGAGGNYGSGGGGGGAALNTHTSGAGGKGAPGVAIISTW